MAYYLSFDGGGSQSRALLFNEQGPLAMGKSGGTNTSAAPIEDVRRNIADCLDQVFADRPGLTLEETYVTIVGPESVLSEELSRRATVRSRTMLGEAFAGILAGALQKSGVVAQAGTGSDAFWVRPDGGSAVVGALGPILGDDGSGGWIGQQALRRALAYEEGWGEPTTFLPLLLERWGLKEEWDLVRMIYALPTPFRKVASCVPVVAEAARAGDAMCLSVFAQAGELMAVQILALLRREGLLQSDQICVCCGGAWKGHPLMYDTFVKSLAAEAPRLTVHKPLFEHFMSGVVLQHLTQFPMATPQEHYEALAGPYEAYRINW